MHKFAKLFERDGRQVLVKRYTNDEDELCLSFETSTPSGCRLTLSMFFTRGSKTECEAALDKAFDDCDEDQAFRVVEKAPGFDL